MNNSRAACLRNGHEGRGNARGIALVLGVLVLLSPGLGRSEGPDREDERKIREILVPFEDLNVLLEGTGQRVLLTREEYDDLLAKARQLPAEESAPHSRILLSARYRGVVEEGRAVVEGEIVLETLSDELVAVPLPLQGVMLRKATLDDRSALLGRNEQGVSTLFVRGKGKHTLRLEMLVPLETSSAQQSLTFQLPRPAATRWEFIVPGNVELKSGAEVIRREVDAAEQVTRLELLPQRAQTTLVLSLNNRIRRQERVVLARSVLLAELTQAYEKLHGTVSLVIPHGAVDRFRFAVPAGFEVTSVTTPLLARWAIANDEEGRPILDVQLREAAMDAVVLQLVLVNYEPRHQAWKFPRLQLLDMDRHTSLIGMLVDERLAATSLDSQELIPVDAVILNSALPASVLQPEPGAPRLRPLAAYFASDDRYSLQAQFRRTEAELDVTSHLLWVLTDRQVQLRAGFAVRPQVERRFALEIRVPAGWQIEQVTTSEGQPLPFELFPGEENSRRLQLRIPHGAPPNELYEILVSARSTPAGWLNDWSQTTFDVPTFAVQGAAQDIGAVAIQSGDDLAVRPDQVQGLTPLDDKEKAEFGLAQTATSLLYRYSSQPYALSLTVERPRPRMTARTFNFFRVEPEGLQAHYEVIYQIEQSRTRRLRLLLPDSTPEALAIRGLNVDVKEFRSESVEGGRQWTVELAEPQRGAVRLAVDFQQAWTPPPAGEDMDSTTSSQVATLPVVRATEVEYQSGTLAVEAHLDFDVQLRFDPLHPLRKVDVGELVDAEYQVGKRLLGTYGFVGQPGEITVEAVRRPEFGLPAAIVQKAELVTVVTAQGLSQTTARFALRTKLPYLEVSLPAGSTLWSAAIEGKPAAPQRDGTELLISFPASGRGELRDLQLVYETPLAAWSQWGQVTVAAPRLHLRDPSGANRMAVPLADLQWHLLLPDGQRLVRSGGTVFWEREPSIPSPAFVAARVALGMITLPAVQASREGVARMERMSELAAPDEATREEASDFSVDPFGVSEPPPRAAPASPASESEKSHFGRPAVRGGASPADMPAGTPAAGAAATRATKTPLWALQGVRSLPVELAYAGEPLTFRSLGADPQLQVTLVRARSQQFLAGLLAIFVGLAGVARTSQSVGRKFRFLVGMGSLLLAAPLVIGLLTELELTVFFAPAFYAVCLVGVWYALAAIARVLVRGGRRIGQRESSRSLPRWRTVALVLAGITATAGPLVAQEPSRVDDLRRLLQPEKPIEIPSDAVLIPYKADDPQGVQQATKVFVPYAEYTALWKRAYPDQPLQEVTPVVPWAVGGVIHAATLTEEDDLLVRSRLEVEVFAAGDHFIPLPIREAVLTRVTVAGQPAQLHLIEPQLAPGLPSDGRGKLDAVPATREPIPAVLIREKGRKEVELELRFRVTQSAGWRRVTGRIPVSTAAALDLTVPWPRTDVRLNVEKGGSATVAVETERESEEIRSAVPADGRIDVQWRPQVAARQRDASLTASSLALLDLQEDGLRLTWQLDLQFPQASRDTFTVQIPRDLLLEKVMGANVRGWKATVQGDVQQVEVSLLQAVTGQEQLVLLLSRHDPIPRETGVTRTAPYVAVPDAALHQGTMVVRRSPRLQVRVEESTGLSRTDVEESRLQALLPHVPPGSPLGIQPYQTYRFAAIPFVLQLEIVPYRQLTRVDVQSVLKVAEREMRFEARLNVHTQNRPRYAIDCRLPPGLKVEEVTGPERLEWTTTAADGGDRLQLILPDGQLVFSVVLRGRLPRPKDNRIPLPTLVFDQVEQRSGSLVVQADPASTVQVDSLDGLRTVLLQEVAGWLDPAQRELAQLAFRYASDQPSGTVRVVPNQPRIKVYTISNSRVTPYAVEDTLYFHYSIAEAGIRSVQFHVPAFLRDARVTVPLLRQKTVETVADQPDRVRFTIELQDEVTNELIVLVQHDRELAGGNYDVPIPVVETGTTHERFVVVENVGRDEVVVTQAKQLDELNQRQGAWDRLTKVLGEQITRGYLVQEKATQPQLEIATSSRAVVETVGARIGLASTLLIVDGSGAYRGVQEYHVDNKTEPYLEIELPEGAELWTVRVAESAVKPVAAPGQNPRGVRVPLIKTAPGDLDYVVELKYGGTIPLPRGLGRVPFPFMHTVNIRVELSQVRLRLPRTHQWVDFGGTMRHVRDDRELLAGFLSYKAKQVEQLLDVARGEGDLFSKARASNNLKQMGFALRQYASYSNVENESLQRELANSTQLLQQAQEVLAQQEQVATQPAATDNRAILQMRCDTQSLSRARDVVTRLQSNFKTERDGAARSARGALLPELSTQVEWLEANRLQQLKPEEAKEVAEGRLKGTPSAEFDRKDQAQSLATAGQLGKKVAEFNAVGQAAPPRSGPAEAPQQAELEEQVKRYQSKLEQSAPATNGVASGDRRATQDYDERVGGMMGGESLYVQPTGEAAGAGYASPPLQGLRSLDVEFPARGVEYRFVTPRGEIAIEGRMIETSRVARLIPLTVLAGAVLLLTAGTRAVRRRFTRAG